MKLSLSSEKAAEKDNSSKEAKLSLWEVHYLMESIYMRISTRFILGVYTVHSPQCEHLVTLHWLRLGLSCVEGSHRPHSRQDLYSDSYFLLTGPCELDHPVPN